MWQKDEILKELKRRGKRITKQRLILLDVILDGQWTCGKEIYYEAIKRDSTIGLATVYRMLGTLEEIGALSRFYHCHFQSSSCGFEGAEAG